MSFPKWLLPVSMSLAGVPIASASPGGSLRSATESDPGSFQITASVLGFGVYKILYLYTMQHLRAGSVSYISLALPYASPAYLQNQRF